MRMLQKSEGGLFATRTVTGHLLRGAVAVALVAAAVRWQHAMPLVAVAAGIGALVALRGCPACWTIGLVQTMRQRWHQRGPSGPHHPQNSQPTPPR